MKFKTQVNSKDLFGSSAPDKQAECKLGMLLIVKTSTAVRRPGLLLILLQQHTLQYPSH